MVLIFRDKSGRRLGTPKVTDDCFSSLRYPLANGVPHGLLRGLAKSIAWLKRGQKSTGPTYIHFAVEAVRVHRSASEQRLL